MCYIVKNVYTVCAHTKMGGLVECEYQKARNEQWDEASCCQKLLSCRPVEQTKLKYWFCGDCREHYAGFNTITVDAVLNYWAFKNAHGYSSSVSPKLIPANLVFGSKAPAAQDNFEHPRRELVALGKELPRKMFETPVAWLQRLEEARARTLELAAKWSAVVNRQRQLRENLDEYVVHMQPRISRPMSVYPYARPLSSITERSESRESTVNPAPSHHPETSPQVHPKTLGRLCGDASSECLPRGLRQAQEAGKHDQNKQKMAAASEPLVSTPLGPEIAQDFRPSHPPPPPHPLSRALTTSRASQRRTSQYTLAVPATVTRDSAAGVSTEAINATCEETVPSRDQSGQTGECINTLPTAPSHCQGHNILASETPEPVQPYHTDDVKLMDACLDKALTTWNWKKHETEAFGQSNMHMTSRFSVPDIDPMTQQSLARADAVSPISVDMAVVDQPETSSRVSETMSSSSEEGYEHETALNTASTIVAPWPRCSVSPSRFVEEYGGAAAEDRDDTDDSWSEVGSSVGRHIGSSPVMVDMSPAEGEGGKLELCLEKPM
ncbi:hypothetical protein N658DRAFT_485561 [Parathielavia hyrcaniae]|uniref:Uncharacterized protein n=1 Tax=Parathielavia hyrcaniae TaxID=113614 RepID=A0AAN6Q257_9PEZI|nr:hypothetical protein N658DRAFT_485561 [Parathielavia hyrcaniae]